jgi:GH35 family endo-1,4-beta-xylanase
MGQETKLAHRKGVKTLKLVTAAGEPVAEQEVSIRLTNHQFLFGCGVFDAIEVANRSVSEERLAFLEEKLSLYLDVFNYGTLPFYWARFEPERGKPRTAEYKAAAEWLKVRNIKVKGHPLCWHTLTAPWLLEMSTEDILQAQLDRIERDVTDFRGLVDNWDVINEVVIMPIFDKYDNGITCLCQRLGRVRMIKEMFLKTRECDPDAVLTLNDFNTSINYEILIDGCLNAGVPIDVIGIQSHQHQGYWGREKLEEVLERFSRFGLPLHFTENTITSGHLMPPDIVDLNDYRIDDWPSTPEHEERQARELEEMYRILFEHPLVENITMWKFSDEGAWLGAPAGFVRKDNSPKPSYEVVKRLIKEEWSTNATTRTDAEGKVQVEGFLGDYELVCKGTSVTFTLGKGESGKLEQLVLP